MPRVLYVVAGAIAGAALAFLAITPNLVPLVSRAIASPSTNAAETYRELELFGKVFEVVRNDYVDQPDYTKLIKSAINGMVDGLDPHSNFMDAKSYQEMQVETSGEFGGL
jgi:carboxyl-terminal processing protease